MTSFKLIFLVHLLKTIDMESMKIEIVNPKAKRLINNLADMDLIRIKKEKVKSDFIELLSKLRKHSDNAPSLDEITQEVESVRKSRYEN
jgi:hypothetical protein